MKRLLGIIISISMVLSLAACAVRDADEGSKTQTQSTTVTTVTKETPYVPTGQITIGIRNPQTLNPILSKDKSVNNMLLLVFDTLFTLDDEQRPVGNLVESYTIDPTGNYVTLVLDSNATWHDGTSVTSDDVLFTIKELKDAAADVLYKGFVENIIRTTKVDDKTLTIYFAQPSNTNLYYLTFPIISKAYYQGKMTLDSNVNFKPMGSGRFQFVDYTNMKHVNLVRNDEYFNTPAKIEKIKCLITKDDETDIKSFHAGVIDISNPEVFNWSDFSSVDDIKPIEYTSYYYDFIGFNFNNELLASKDIRKLIAYGINRDKIVKDIYIKHNTIVDSPFHPGAWFAKNYTTIYNNDQVEIDKYKSVSYLTDANNDKILDKNGINITFRLLVNNNDSTRVQSAELIKSQLEAVGIGITLESVDYETYKARLETKDFDLFLGGWLLLPSPDFGFMFHSQSGTNYIAYQDEKMNDLLLKAYQSVSDEDIMINYKNLHDYIQDEIPYFSLYFRNSAVVLGKNVSGDMKPSTYNLFKGIENISK